MNLTQILHFEHSDEEQNYNCISSESDNSWQKIKIKWIAFLQIDLIMMKNSQPVRHLAIKGLLSNGIGNEWCIILHIQGNKSQRK